MIIIGFLTAGVGITLPVWADYLCRVMLFFAMKYLPTIGLEIHTALKTRTKMFCQSKNDPDEKRPNVNICPICLGHPGTLPVINKEAVKQVLKVGLAFGGQIADFTEFDRKNYFYPDIPKGYQISQYKYPLVSGGNLGGVAITRVHLEEDTGTSLHDRGDYSLVDFNRAGVPLMELVTEPVIHSAKVAVNFARELQLLLRYLGVSEANMEKGEMRAEANVSVQPISDPQILARLEKDGLTSSWPVIGKLGTKVEIKNLNSFKSVEKAIEYEVRRQIRELENGREVIQETRGWDENKGITFSQRRKENSHDYRYFPDPDLPKLRLSEVPEFSIELLKKELPELPAAKRLRLKDRFGLRPEVAEIFIQDRDLGDFFESVAETCSVNTAKLAANYIVSDLVGLMRLADGTDSLGINERKIGIKPADFSEIIKMVNDGQLSSRGAKDLIKIMFEKGGGDPRVIAKEAGLFQQSDSGFIDSVVTKVIEKNPQAVSDFKAGKSTALQFLIGQGMKESRGSANPDVLKKIISQRLTQ